MFKVNPRLVVENLQSNCHFGAKSDCHIIHIHSFIIFILLYYSSVMNNSIIAFSEYYASWVWKIIVDLLIVDYTNERLTLIHNY